MNLEATIQLVAILVVALGIGLGLLKAVFGEMLFGEGRSGGKEPRKIVECPNCGREIVIRESDERANRSSSLGIWKECRACEGKFKLHELLAGSSPSKATSPSTEERTRSKKSSRSKAKFGSQKGKTTTTPHSLVLTVVLAIMATVPAGFAFAKHGFELFLCFLIPSVLVVFAVANYSWAKKAVVYPFRMLYFITIGALLQSVFGISTEGAWSSVVAMETEHQQNRRGEANRSNIFLNIPQALCVSILLPAVLLLLIPKRPAAQPNAANEPAQQPLPKKEAAEAPGIQEQPAMDAAANEPNAIVVNDDESLRKLLADDFANSDATYPQARDYLARLLEPTREQRNDRNVMVNGLSLPPRAAVLNYLPRFGFSNLEARRIIRRLLTDGSQVVREVAPEALTNLAIGQKDIADDWEVLLKHETTNSSETTSLEKALKKLGEANLSELLLFLKFKDESVRRRAEDVVLRIVDMEKLGIQALREHVDDREIAPVVLQAVLRIRPLPKEAVPLIIASLPHKPELTIEALNAMNSLPSTELKEQTDWFAKLLADEAFANRESALTFLLATKSSEKAIRILVERVESNEENKQLSRDLKMLQTACNGITNPTPEFLAFLVMKMIDDKTREEMIRGTHGALLRVAQQQPELIPGSLLIEGFADQTDGSQTADRIQEILRKAGSSVAKDLFAGTKSKTTDIRVWCFRTLARKEFANESPQVVKMSAEYAKLALENRDQRLAKAAYQLLANASGDFPKSTIAIAERHLKNKDPERAAWALTIFGKQ